MALIALFKRGRAAAALAFLIGGAAVWSIPPAPKLSPSVAAPPLLLRETGLYSDFALRTVDPRNMSYSPQYPLWSDGAAKKRWIYLPAGASIDASDPDVWEFPVGTKVWKEFSFHGRRVETRLMASLGDGDWTFASYVWDKDESEATLAPEGGVRDAAEIQPGLGHNIPSILDCKACHVNRRVEILGFSALQLSTDRDPLAPHAEALASGMVNLRTLIDRKLIRSFPSAWKDKPLRIAASDPTARAALGYLHANCGNCHNPNGSLETLNLLLRYSVSGAASKGSSVETAFNRQGRLRIPGVAPDTTFLLRPGDPDHSALLYRMATRNPYRQMPALGTKLVDTEAVTLIRQWIMNIQLEERP
jgi:hypothetical protein